MHIEIEEVEILDIEHWKCGEDTEATASPTMAKLALAHQRLRCWMMHPKPFFFFPIEDKRVHGEFMRHLYFIHPRNLPPELSACFLFNDLFYSVCLEGQINLLEVCSEDPSLLLHWYNKHGLKYVGVYIENSRVPPPEQTDSVPSVRKVPNANPYQAYHRVSDR